MTLRIIPAIDLLDGSCVRLLHGDFNRCKVYELDAGRLAADYADQGAEWLHVVDLAASRDGPKADTRPLMRLLQSAPQSVQTGGGVRNESDIQNRLGSGAQRVVVGSMCVTQPREFAAWPVPQRPLWKMRKRSSQAAFASFSSGTRLRPCS